MRYHSDWGEMALTGGVGHGWIKNKRRQNGRDKGQKKSW